MCQATVQEVSVKKPRLDRLQENPLFETTKRKSWKRPKVPSCTFMSKSWKNVFLATQMWDVACLAVLRDSYSPANQFLLAQEMNSKILYSKLDKRPMDLDTIPKRSLSTTICVPLQPKEEDRKTSCSSRSSASTPRVALELYCPSPTSERIKGWLGSLEENNKNDRTLGFSAKKPSLRFYYMQKA